MAGVAVWYFDDAESEFRELQALEADAVALVKDLRSRPRSMVEKSIVPSRFNNVFIRRRYLSRSISFGYYDANTVEGWLVVVYGWGPPGILWVLGAFLEADPDLDQQLSAYEDAAADALNTTP